MVYTHLPVPKNSVPLQDCCENFQNILKKRKYSNSMLISHRNVYGKNTYRISTMKNIFSNFLENAKIL